MPVISRDFQGLASHATHIASHSLNSPTGRVGQRQFYYSCFLFQAELIKTQEMLRPASMAASNTPCTLSPISVATNMSNCSPPFRGPVIPKRGDDNGCLDLSTNTATSSITTITSMTPVSSSGTSTDDQAKNGVESLRKCHICGAELSERIEELTRHLAFVHLIPMPLMLGQLAVMAAGLKSGQNKPPSSSTPQNFPPVPSLPTLQPPGLLPPQENIPRKLKSKSLCMHMKIACI